MKEGPISFRHPMVQATLAGRKTQTRLVLKPQPNLGAFTAAEHRWIDRGEGVFGLEVKPTGRNWWADAANTSGDITIKCPYGLPGDRLWVREKWGDADLYYRNHQNDCPSVIAYAADKSAIQWDAVKPRPIPEYDISQWNWDKIKWRSSTHMPRWASRIILEVTDVRVERVQSISREDAMAEGIDSDGGTDRNRSTLENFHLFWDSTNAKSGWGWEVNPWVWAISFKIVNQEQSENSP